MAQQFDLVVIGTGVAGAPVATACRQAGWEVALVDDYPYGGTCALRGCDPKKVLVGCGRCGGLARRMAGKGIEPGGVRIDWPALIRFKDSFTTPRPAARRAGSEQAGIACFDGHARFVRPTMLRVGDEELEGRHVVIATGAKPMSLGIAGEEHITISDDFFDLEVLPERVLFIGGATFRWSLPRRRSGRCSGDGAPPQRAPAAGLRRRPCGSAHRLLAVTWLDIPTGYCRLRHRRAGWRASRSGYHARRCAHVRDRPGCAWRWASAQCGQYGP